MLEIVCPVRYQAERRYILDLFLDEFWGLNYNLSWSKETNNKTVFKNDGRILILHDGLFRVPENAWLQEKSLPRVPLKRWDFSRVFPELKSFLPCPLIYSAGILQNQIIFEERRIEFDLDILGSCFFMLTRYEEIVKKDRDEHGRFPAAASLACQEDFLERPIVNEYMEIMWAAMHRLFPSLRRKQRMFRLIPTHDIDHPFGMVYESPLQILRHFVGDLLYRKSLSVCKERLRELWEIYFHRDRYIKRKKTTYRFLYKISRKNGLKDIYFFMDSKRSQLDGNYTVNEPEVRTLLLEIHKESHDLGLHPSYVSCVDRSEILREVENVNQVLAKLGLPPLVGARQHYLRWVNPTTWKNYEVADIPFDSSLGFADRVGFRSGICYAYPVFDLRERQQLRVRELPLIVMDETLIGYMHLDEADAKEKVLALANECIKYNGDFVILWHNTTLDDEVKRAFYQEMIERILKEYGRGAIIE